MANNRLPKIAVCLAVHNGMRWLPTLLTSILEQVGVSLTIFISVDPSEDDSEVWVAEQSTVDSRIILLPQGNHFPASSQNFFRLCRDVDFMAFDYVSFADQDDIWMPGRLLRAMEQLMETGCAGYSSNVQTIWESEKEGKLINKAQPQVRWDYLFEAPGPGCTFVVTQALAIQLQQHLLGLGLLATKLTSHDWFIYAYARAQGNTWHIDSEPTLYYRQHDQNDVGVNEGFAAAVRRWHTITDGSWLQQIAYTAEAIGMKEDVFVQQWLPFRRCGFLVLAKHAGKCRRRLRDKALFKMIFLYWSVVGWHPK